MNESPTSTRSLKPKRTATSARGPSAEARLLRAYLDASYRIRIGSKTICWRVGLTAKLDAVAQGQAFALLTAWNPRSEPSTGPLNRAAQALLIDSLAAVAETLWPAENSDPSGNHAEESVLALGLDLERCDALAKRFGQNAAVVGSIGAPLRLRVYRAWRDAARRAGLDTRFVDWVDADSVA